MTYTIDNDGTDIANDNSWATVSSAWDVRGYSDVEVQFTSTPSTPYQPQRSLDGSNFVNSVAFDESGTMYTTISAAGIYTFNGNGYLKFSAGAGSTLFRRKGV